jgi:hypothetical protein
MFQRKPRAFARHTVGTLPKVHACNGFAVDASRGYEHITDLEPALFEHMKRTIPGLSEKSSAQIQGLLRRGIITQDDITRSLVDFHAGMYPQLGRQQIVDALKGGL